MGLSKRTCHHILSITLIIFLHFGLATSISDYTTFVYKTCSDRRFSASSATYSQTLSSLFVSLTTQASHSMFYKTSTLHDERNTIFGLFQCRGDLSNIECYSCVKKLQELSISLCGETLGARIQLSGCYIRYGTDDFGDKKGGGLFYKSCGGLFHDREVGFEGVRDQAFSEVVGGGVKGFNGFCERRYEPMFVMVQCEGVFGSGCDCRQCISNAVEIAKGECGSSVSGQIYMDECFLSYGDFPDGFPGQFHQGEGKGNDSGRGMAIAFGGGAALLLGVTFMVFLKSWGKKNDDC